MFKSNYVSTEDRPTYGLLAILFTSYYVLLFSGDVIFNRSYAVEIKALMSSLLRERINHKYSDLVQDICSPDHLVALLLQEGVLTHWNKDEIGGITTEYGKNAYLLHILSKRPNKDIPKIVYCFDEANQHAIARIMGGQPNVGTELSPSNGPQTSSSEQVALLSGQPNVGTDLSPSNGPQTSSSEQVALLSDTRSATALSRQPDNSVDRDSFPRSERSIPPACGERGASDTDQAPNPAGPAEIAVLSGDGRRASDSDQVPSQTSSADVPSLSGTNGHASRGSNCLDSPMPTAEEGRTIISGTNGDASGGSNCLDSPMDTAEEGMTIISGNGEEASNSDAAPEQIPAGVPLLSAAGELLSTLKASRKIGRRTAKAMVILLVLLAIAVVIGVVFGFVLPKLRFHGAAIRKAHGYDPGDDSHDRENAVLGNFSSPRPCVSHTPLSPHTSSSSTPEVIPIKSVDSKVGLLKDDVTFITPATVISPVPVQHVRNGSRDHKVTYVLHIKGQLECPGNFMMADHVLIVGCGGQKIGKETFSNYNGFFGLDLLIIVRRSYPYLLLVHSCSKGRGVFQRRISHYYVKYGVPPTQGEIDLGEINLRSLKSRPALNHATCR